MPYLPLTSSIQCVDDTDSKFYNTLVDTSKISPDWGQHENEKMRRPDDLYRLGHSGGPQQQSSGRGKRLMHLHAHLARTGTADRGLHRYAAE